MRGEPEIQHRPSTNCRVVHVRCATHGAPIGYTNLVVHGTIELDLQAARACVILIDESGAAVLRDALTAWLG